jgi:sec-independent protein translocase protein TatC
MNTPHADNSAEGSLIEHLLELRARLIRALLGLGTVLLALLPFTRHLYDWLAAPLLSRLPQGQQHFIALNPAGAFFAPLKLTMYVALFVSAPWVLYQVWAFVAPGLYQREKKLARPLLVSAMTLFYAGCAFAYFLVLPAVFNFLVKFSPSAVAITPDANIYLSFVVTVFFAFGLSFELPVALVIMTLMGWVTPKQLADARGYAILGIFILAAVITPPDAVSQLMLAIPMCLLYELGIIASKWVSKKPAETAGQALP